MFLYCTATDAELKNINKKFRVYERVKRLETLLKAALFSIYLLFICDTLYIYISDSG